MLPNTDPEQAEKIYIPPVVRKTINIIRYHTSIPDTMHCTLYSSLFGFKIKVSREYLGMRATRLLIAPQSASRHRKGATRIHSYTRTKIRRTSHTSWAIVTFDMSGKSKPWTPRKSYSVSCMRSITRHGGWMSSPRPKAITSTILGWRMAKWISDSCLRAFKQPRRSRSRNRYFP